MIKANKHIHKNDKILLTGAYRYTKKQLSQVKSIGFDVRYVANENIPLKIDPSSINAVVCNNLFANNDISKFKNLKYIQITSSGYDRIPIEYIRSHGINLADAKGVYSAPIAEWVILKILEIYKKTNTFYDAQKERKWFKQKDILELTGRTIAIVGFGSIGVEISKRLKPFDVRIIAVDNRKIDRKFLINVNEFRNVSRLKQILSRSDIVILAVPLNRETKYLFDDRIINAMKIKSVLINISRGGVIDEGALLKAINKNKLLGVALDVFEKEPLPKNSPLWSKKNVSITPHNSYMSDKVGERLFQLIYCNLRNYMATRLSE